MHLVMSELDTPDFREKRARFTRGAMESALLGNPDRSNLILTFCESSTRAATNLGDNFTVILDVDSMTTIAGRLKYVLAWIKVLEAIEEVQATSDACLSYGCELMGLINAEIEALGHTYDATEHAMT